jgi:hypothetical protein
VRNVEVAEARFGSGFCYDGLHLSGNVHEVRAVFGLYLEGVHWVLTSRPWYFAGQKKQKHKFENPPLQLLAMAIGL